ncbi:MAG: cytochrome c [Amphritea sp.]|nr:cytochrome c [Amphritea sp.]MBQ0783390.1 cytochrome c [Amphritea sp.]
MRIIKMKSLVILISVILLSGCSDSEPRVEGRWYSQSQVDMGKRLFIDNCAECHGVAAQGTRDWNKPEANGKYPPPPLNGKAHAWHHPLKGLKQSITNGGIAIGGSMPGFGDKLSDAETDAVISFFQTKWPQPTYQAWIDRGGLN